MPNKKSATKKPVSTKKNKLLSTQRYLNIASVHNDVAVLQNGDLNAILEIGAVNFNLKSTTEQESIIYSYQRFLNALDFPIQILVRSRKLDIDRYLNDLRKTLKNQTNKLLHKQMSEYIQYIQKLVEYANIMEKKFLVVVSVSSNGKEQSSIWKTFIEKITPDDNVGNVIKRKKEFATLSASLNDRVNVVQTALENCNLFVRRLNTAEIINILYQSYNPISSRYQKLDELDKISHNGNPEDQIIGK